MVCGSKGLVIINSKAFERLAKDHKTDRCTNTVVFEKVSSKMQLTTKGPLHFTYFSKRGKPFPNSSARNNQIAELGALEITWKRESDR